MRQVAASADPDRPARLITLPVSWDDRAAEALAALAPGEGPASLAQAANAWLAQIAQRARAAGQPEEIALQLHALLHHRRAAPNAAIWRGDAEAPGYTLNAAGFHDATQGFDVAGFGEAACLAARACKLLAPDARRYEIGLSGLDDLLACLGLDYDSHGARGVGASLAALLRARVELALEGDQADLLATQAEWPAPPAGCAIPGLAESARAAHNAIRRTPGGIPATGVFPPGAADAFLGIETGGIAPAFSPVRDRRLTRAAQNRLAAGAMSPEVALASVLTGGAPLPIADLRAHEAMHAAIAPYLDIMPGLPAALPAPLAQTGPDKETGYARHRALPTRHAGITQKASVGGHRVFLRSSEYADGRLGDMSLVLPRESAAVRGLAECFAQAVSIGLQHGVPLEAYVEAFALTRFGPAGVVEGDAGVARATSVIDYAMRSLAVNYLGRALPDPVLCETEPDREEAAPMLPLDLPRGRRLRLVA